LPLGRPSLRVMRRFGEIVEVKVLKLPGPHGRKFIDVLLMHGLDECNTEIADFAIGIRRSNVPSLIFKLNKAGLIDKKPARSIP